MSEQAEGNLDTSQSYEHFVLDFLSECRDKRSQRHEDLVASCNKLAASHGMLAESCKRHDLADEEERKVILKILETKEQYRRAMTSAANGDS